MATSGGIPEALERMMRSRMTYLAVTAGFLFYFTVNYSSAGVSKDVLDAYAGLLGLGTLIYLYVLSSSQAGADLEPAVESPLLGSKVEQRWEVMAATAALGLFGTITLVAVMHRMTGVPPPQVDPGLVWPNLVQQAFVVVTTETLIFHQMLPEVLRRAGRLKENTTAHYALYYGASQAVFAAMHWSAYGGNFQSLMLVFVLGLVLLYLADRFGAAAAWGVHTGWNLLALGIILGSV